MYWVLSLCVGGSGFKTSGMAFDPFGTDAFKVHVHVHVCTRYMHALGSIVGHMVCVCVCVCVRVCVCSRGVKEGPEEEEEPP